MIGSDWQRKILSNYTKYNVLNTQYGQQHPVVLCNYKHILKNDLVKV